MNDRRREPRLTWGTKVQVLESGTGRIASHEARLRNIAKHGFGFVTGDHLNRGQHYRFRIDLLTSQLEVTARVVHFQIESTYYVCGARVEKMSILQRSRINRFLAARSPQLRRRYLLSSMAIGLVTAGTAALLGAGLPVGGVVFAGMFAVLFLTLPF